MKVVRCLDEKIWRCFVNDHPDGNIFHTPEMFQVFARTKGHRPTLWATVDDDARVLALLLPVRITLVDHLYRLTTRAVVYGGVLHTPGPEGRDALALLLQTYTQEIDGALLFTELRNLSDMGAVEPILRMHSFFHEDHLNYLIDLNRPIQETWDGISKSGRKAVRRSVRRGVVHEAVQDRSLLPTFYELLRQTYARVGVPLADISLFEAVFDILVPRGMAKMLLARVQGRYVAVSLEMPYKNVIFSWYSGYDQEYRTFYPNDSLVWCILEWGARNGYRCYDFGGAGRPGVPYGVRDFKAKFGGRLVNYGRHTCVHAPCALALSRRGYGIYSKMMRYLQTRKLGPSV